MGRVMRAVLLLGPCRLYVACEVHGRLPLSWFAGMFGFAGLAGAVGATVALVRGVPVSDEFWVWALGGLLAFTVWLVYSLVVVGVLWVRGVGPDEVLAADAAPAGRREGPDVARGWRRRGIDPSVPGSLVAFFALTSAVALLTVILATASDRQFSRGADVTSAKVLAVEGPAWWDKGAGTILVRFSVGSRELTTHISGELGDGKVGDVPPQLGEQLEVEYLRSDPQTAQATATAQENKSDLGWARWFFAGAVLGLIVSGIGWVVGRRRQS